jgi:hypothetical protein
MNRFRWMLVFITLGTIFWIPSVIIHGLRGREFGVGRLDVLSVTSFSIIAAVLALEVMSRWQWHPFNRPTIALSMLFGIWFFGPFCMMISASFSGGGFFSPEPWLSLASAVVLFLPYTFMMSTYDGTLGALLIITVLFLIIGAVGLASRFRRSLGAPAEHSVMPISDSDKLFLVVRCLGAVGGLIGGAISGTIVIVLLMVVTGSTFGLSNIWSGTVTGAMLGALLGCLLFQDLESLCSNFLLRCSGYIQNQRRPDGLNPPLKPMARLRDG